MRLRVALWVRCLALVAVFVPAFFLRAFCSSPTLGDVTLRERAPAAVVFVALLCCAAAVLEGAASKDTELFEEGRSPLAEALVVRVRTALVVRSGIAFDYPIHGVEATDERRHFDGRRVALANSGAAPNEKW